MKSINNYISERLCVSKDNTISERLCVSKDNAISERLVIGKHLITHNKNYPIQSINDFVHYYNLEYMDDAQDERILFGCELGVNYLIDDQNILNKCLSFSLLHDKEFDNYFKESNNQSRSRQNGEDYSMTTNHTSKAITFIIYNNKTLNAELLLFIKAQKVTLLLKKKQKNDEHIKALKFLCSEINNYIKKYNI